MSKQDVARKLMERLAADLAAAAKAAE